MCKNRREVIRENRREDRRENRREDRRGRANIGHNVVRKVVSWLVLGWILCSGSIAFAFWDQPHQLIAEVASRYLTPTTTGQTARLLALPIAEPGSRAMSLNTRDFAAAASWADNIKLGPAVPSRKGNRSYPPFAQCHYIDIELTQAMTGLSVTEADAASRLSAAMRKTPENVVSCLKRSIHTLSGAGYSDLQKAIALRMVLHLVGDLGQPLHTTNLLVSTPSGVIADAGGNAVVLSRGVCVADVDGGCSRQKNLHALWDGGLGAYVQFSRHGDDAVRGVVSDAERQSVREEAARLVASPEFDAELKKLTLPGANLPGERSIEAWAVDSYRIAVSDAYTGVTLKPIGRGSERKLQATFSSGWKNYEAERRPLIRQQIIKSAIRLACVLNALFDPSAPDTVYSALVSAIAAESALSPLRLN